MDSAVRARRSLRASRPLKTTLYMSVAQPLHPVQNGVDPRLEELVDDPAVGKEDHPVGVRGRDRVVVTMTIVWPNSSTARRRKASRSAPDRESSAPVGSS